MTTYTIDKRYKTSVKRSDRVLEVAEWFGLGLSDREFVVFDNCDIDVRQGDIVYITGQSGAGKSTVLRELAAQMEAGGLPIADIDKVEFKDCALVDQIGKTATEGLQMLGIAGINDAFLYIRKPQELSDGQRYRFRLAKLIESGAKVWVADEFLAVLDREAAKAIASTLQRAARKLGVTMLVATTHSDMVEDLNPDLTIVKHYREKVKLTRANEETGAVEPAQES